MQQAGTDFILSCMQSSDNVTLARDLNQYGVKAHQLWLDGYDYSLLGQYKNLMQGVYVNSNGNVPFSADTTFPGKYPGMQQYLTTMQKYAPNYRALADGAAGLPVRVASRGRHQGGRVEPDPAERDHRDQQAGGLHRQRYFHRHQLGERPQRGHVPDLFGVREGPGQHVRTGLHQGVPGVRVLPPPEAST